jgi:Arc-like DNA binding domain
MELAPIIGGIAEDLRRTASVGDEETRRVAELLVSGIDPTLRLHLIEAIHRAARELEDSAPGATVEVRLTGRDPVLSLLALQSTAEEEGGGGTAVGGYADDELLRLTIRLPEGLKSRVEQAAASVGASINSWIVAALARALDAPGPARTQPGRRMPRRITGFVQG